MALAVFHFVPVVHFPVARHHWAQPGPILLTPALEVFVYIAKIPSHSSLLQGKLLPHREMLQVSNHLQSPSLDPLRAPCLSRSPELDTAVQICPHQGWDKGQDHLPWPTGNALPKAPRIPLNFLATRTHCWGKNSFLSIRIPRFFSTELLSSRTKLPLLKSRVKSMPESCKGKNCLRAKYTSMKWTRHQFISGIRKKGNNFWRVFYYITWYLSLLVKDKREHWEEKMNMKVWC